MDHADHVELLRRGVPAPGGVWADIGAGSGAFTLALAELLGPGAEIHAVDRDRHALQVNAGKLRAAFPKTSVHYHRADFTLPLALPVLDGIVTTNALHFQVDQPSVVKLLRGYLRPGGRLLVVEYNIARANFAVPHPVPYSRWQQLASGAGFQHTDLLATRPSRSLREIYSAVSW